MPTLQNYALLFLDILNQREQLKSVENLSRPLSQANQDEIIRVLSKTVGLTSEVIKAIDESIRISNSHKPPDGTPQDQIEKVKKWLPEAIKRKEWADSIISYVPVGQNQQSERITVFGLHKLLMMASNIMLTSLGSKIPIRGGLDIGLAVETDNDRFYGPVLFKSYDLENKVAQWPRIVVGNEVLEFLNANSEVPVIDERSRVQYQITQVAMKLITTDVDGAHMIDYLGESIISMMPSYKIFFKPAYEFIKSEYNRFTEERNHKLALRYAMIKSYFDSHAKAWEN